MKPQVSISESIAFNNKRRYWTVGRFTLLGMALPSFIFLLLFAYGPIFGWIYAFFDYRIGMRLSQAEFMGLHYFRIAFSDPDILRVLLNTLAISFLGLLSLPLAALFAIFLSEMKWKKYQKFVQTASTLPHFISWIIVFSLSFALFSPESGLMNRILLQIGIIDTPLNPMANNQWAWFFQAALFIWKGLGYSAIIFFAAIASIDRELHEAADVDGAGRYMKIWHITVPGMMPTFIVLLLLNIGSLLSNGFEQYYVFMNPLVQSKLEVLDYYVYKVGLALNDVPVATAFSILKTIISICLLLGANLLSRKIADRGIL
ncbi:ABC transporter permease subunit [Paenibacillus daejeonensis]|uniref:ABC transporter permease subunit n=1 Tax=Paenibacillus daejeonensis TaxID=135193 RepID=UPI00036AF395|nr:ABC transporter permease subunit [Paenibacillus daejeonensis]